MFKNLSSAVLAAFLGMLCLSGPAQAVTIFGDDFRFEPYGTYDSATSLTKWDVMEGSVALINCVVGTVFNQRCLALDYLDSVDRSATVKTKDAFGFNAGQTYSFSITAGTNAPEGFTVKIGDFFQKFYSTIVPGVAIDVADVSSFVPTTDGFASIEIWTVGGQPNGTDTGPYISNVSLSGPAFVPPPVPLPAAGVLLLTALLGFGAVSRRRG